MTIHFKNGKSIGVSMAVIDQIRKLTLRPQGAEVLQWFSNERDELFLCINISEISHITN